MSDTNTKLRARRVVIADSDPANRCDLLRILEEAGHEVVAFVSDGAAAMQAAKIYRPDIAVLDAVLPTLDGMETSRILRQAKIAPAVVLFAHDQAELVRRAREAGVFGLLAKPFQQANLLSAIEMAIGRWERLRNLDRHIRHLDEKIKAREVIQRAKTLLMEQHYLKEQEAFRRLQVRSMNTRTPMYKVAEAICLAHQTHLGVME